MKNTQQSISALVVLLCLATALSVAAKPKKGDPEGSDRFKGVFTRVSGGNLIMSSTGVETTVTLQPKTPIIGMFRAGKPLIDKAKGVINYQLLMSPSGNRYEEYKLQENCREIKGYRRFSFITGFTPRGLEHHGVHLEVVGFPEGENKIRAHAVYFEPVKDPLPHENPKLPRLLFIGDSISFNYNDGLRAALNGKMNAQHPRTNCADITVISSWLGAYEKPGRQWDVIAFNGGHWNSGSTKEEYQAAFLEALTKLKKTGAKVIRVTTCPVPFGYNLEGSTTDSTVAKAPRDKWPSIRHEFKGEILKRVPGRMRLQNQWAAEMLEKHPDVVVCDQWQFVKDGEKVKDGPYEVWWYCKNVHFRSKEQAVPLGELLAETALVVSGKKELGAANPKYRKYVHLSAKGYEPAKTYD